MKKWGLWILAVLALPATMWAAQVDVGEYIQSYGRYGRSDGWFQRKDTGGFDLHVNGQRLVSAGKAVYEDFSEYQDGDMFCEQTDFTVCSATHAEINRAMFPSGNVFMWSGVVGDSTAGIDMDAGSLDIAGDQTNTEGLEVWQGSMTSAGGVFVVGEDPAFYGCWKVAVADVSGLTSLRFGFREATSVPADAYDTYTDYATIGPDAGDVYLRTDIANAGVTSTDTTENLADAGNDTYCVFVSAAGVVTYTIDGHAPATTAAYTLADSLEVIPFAHLIQSADLSGEVDLYEWEVGYGTAPF
jgi:hypothetical protein